MTGAPDSRKRPASAALTSGKDRAVIVQREAPCTIANPEREADFAAQYVARRYGLSLPLARAIAALAAIVGRCV